MPRRGEGGRRSGTLAAAVCLLVGLLACQPPPPVAPAGPRLLLLIAADQFRGDYLDRFAGLWTGGLKRLREEGAVFTDAHHRHAVTHTATGYATLVTGCHPRRHGVIANYWVDPAERRLVYSVGDAEHGVSPGRLLEPALGDRLKERSPRSRVYAASGKDRAAALMGGRAADAAFWYDEKGRWTSSTYYPGATPDWLEEFHALGLADREFGKAWEPLPVAAEELVAAGIRELELGPLVSGFPHVFGGLVPVPNSGFYDALASSPWLDEYLTRFAERLIVEEGLGADGWTDLLALGYSALDVVGHEYGPDSREALDTLLRLDRTLGELLEFVDRRIGLDNVVVALSSDHGAAPMPELGGGGRRVDAADVLCFQRLDARLAERFGDDRWILPGPFVNPAALEGHGLEREVVEEAAARLLEECPPVERVWRRGELVAPGPQASPLFVNTFHPERSPDLLVDFEPYYMPTWFASTHGSSRPYDTHVPLVVLAAGVDPLRDTAPAATVDLVPTLAALAGLPAAGVDGRDLGPRLAARPLAP